MFNILILSLLFVYYWYFFTSYSKPVPKPATGAPSKAEQTKPYFDMQLKHQFTVKVNGRAVWHHTLPRDRYVLRDLKIVPKDVCYGEKTGRMIEAKGEILYNYLTNRPDTTLNPLSFHENVTPYTVQRGSVYYFTCSNNRIQRLNICPSGTTFRNSNCVDLNMCTGMPDGAMFPGSIISNFIKCRNERETREVSCGPDLFFYHSRCVRMKELAHWCKFFPNKPFVVDETTRIECRNGSLVRIECAPGTKFFDKDYCEPVDCVGRPDYDKLPLPERKVDPFHFSPGYRVCIGGKVSHTVECPQTWDDSLTKGDNLTFLPMVFDGTECSVPAFSENVFSNDPDVLVPVHEFTKHLRNWKHSDSYDRAVGFESGRKRRILPPDMRIGKRFKAEPACEPRLKLAVHRRPNEYYDCDLSSVVTCPDREYFDGAKCAAKPLHPTFEFQNIPVFSFDSLNFESWIAPLDYEEVAKSVEHSCREPESTFVKLHNVCSHPDCTSYAFLSTIPDLAMLLPADRRAKCRFDEANRRLVKEDVAFAYRFWDQKLTDEEKKDAACTPGQKLQTGNFIWDSTVFATCDPTHPFVFCPSAHSRRGLMEIRGTHDTVYACTPPDTNKVVVEKTGWTSFVTNELMRIEPAVWTGTPSLIRVSRDPIELPLPEEGLEIPKDQKVTLFSREPVRVELRNRVTYPPRVAFEYDDRGVVHPRIGSDSFAFIMRRDDFTNKSMKFPRYKFTSHVDSIEGNHLV